MRILSLLLAALVATGAAAPRAAHDGTVRGRIVALPHGTGHQLATLRTRPGRTVILDLGVPGGERVFVARTIMQALP